MSCFSLGFLQQLLVWVVIVIAVVSILRLLVPWLVSFIGIPMIGQVIQIILWAIVAIACIYFIFALLSCLVGGGGGIHFPYSR